MVRLCPFRCLLTTDRITGGPMLSFCIGREVGPSSHTDLLKRNVSAPRSRAVCCMLSLALGSTRTDSQPVSPPSPFSQPSIPSRSNWYRPFASYNEQRVVCSCRYVRQQVLFQLRAQRPSQFVCHLISLYSVRLEQSGWVETVRILCKGRGGRNEKGLAYSILRESGYWAVEELCSQDHLPGFPCLLLFL